MTPNISDTDFDDAVASGTSLEMGSMAYRTLIMNKAGLTAHDRERILRLNLDEHLDETLDEIEAEPSPAEEYGEQLEDDRAALTETAMVEAEDVVESQLHRMESEELVREAQAAAAIAAMRAMAGDTQTSLDDTIVEDIIDDVEAATYNRHISSDEFEGLIDRAQDEAVDVIDEIQDDIECDLYLDMLEDQNELEDEQDADDDYEMEM